MKTLLRILAVPIGILVGCIVWLIVYLQIFNSIQLLPVSELIIKLSPGLLIGGFLGYRYPGLFFWFISFDGDVDVSDLSESTSNSETGNKPGESAKKK